VGEYYSFLDLISTNYKTILGSVGALCGLAGYICYYVNIFRRGGNKPCLFTWVPLALIIGFGFYAQIKTGAMWGAVVTGVTGINCIIIAVISIFCKKTKPEWSDWVCFIGAIVAIVWWRISNGLIMPVIIVSFADAIAFFPTWKRGYQDPFGETAWMWFLNCIKFVFGIMALGTYGVTTLLFPLTVAGVNGIFVIIILSRRKYLIALQGESL
jgi:hypothetical protein